VALQLLLYGDVGYDINTRDVSAALAGSKDDSVLVRISSGGGHAVEGLTIYNLLRSSGKKITVAIDGLAGSAASVIAMAGDEIRISESALMMIHNSSAGLFGNSEDLREQADVLDKLDHAMAAAYARKSGKPADHWRTEMKTDRWMTAEETVAAGLADKIVEPSKLAAQVKSARSWNELPDEVKTNLQQRTEAAIVDIGMTPEQLQEALNAALAPLLGRLEALETRPAPAAETISVEIAPSAAAEVTATLEAQELFAAAVDSAYAQFVRDGKIAPSPLAEKAFRAGCRSAADFKDVCAHYAAAPAVVATASVTLPVAGSKGKQPTEAQLEFARKNGFNVKQMWPDYQGK
jgi:ATP-dependent Clp protease protease subunit